MEASEIRKLLTEMPLEQLLARADKVRSDCVGDVVHIRALLEFSNYCSRNCTYCGLTADNMKVKRYMMNASEILTVARQAFDVGYKTIVMQSGEADAFDILTLADIVKEISGWGMMVTVSCGELSYDDYKVLHEAGADRYLLKHECADQSMYAKLHNGYTLEERLDCARNIKKLGYEYGGGFLVGLPDENIELIVNNLLLLVELDCDMLGIGTFIPHPDTQLGAASSGDYEMTLRCVAIARILLPNANIPVTTSLSIVGDSQLVYSSGANVVMVKVTPPQMRECYEIYPGVRKGTDIEKDRRDIVAKIESMNRIAM